MIIHKSQPILIERKALDSGISLEAIGLLAYLEAQHEDSAEPEELQVRFPEYDVDAICAELLSAGLVTREALVIVPEPQTPVIENAGWVYVYECLGRYKVGVTSNLKRRLKQLRTHSPGMPSLIWQRKYPNPVEIESAIHKRLAVYRTHGEWYNCDRTIVDAALPDLKSACQVS